jgi:hypothetical protein
MIRIVQGGQIKQRNDTEWRRAQNANAGNFDTNLEPMTSQTDVDAIAAAMDAPETVESIPTPQEQPAQAPLADPREQDIARMMQQYVQQNGGIPIQQEQTNKNKVILG